MELFALEDWHPKAGEPKVLVAHRKEVLPPNHIDHIFRSLYPVAVSILHVGGTKSAKFTKTVEPINIYYNVSEKLMVTVIGKVPESFNEPLSSGELLQLFDSAYFAGYCQLMASAMVSDQRWNEKTLEEDMERRICALCKQDAYNLDMHRPLIDMLLPSEL